MNFFGIKNRNAGRSKEDGSGFGWKRLIRYAVYALITVAAVFGIPWGMNEIYRRIAADGYIWDVSDVLGYFGATMSTIASVWVLKRTIEFTRRQIRYEQYVQNEYEKWTKIEDQFVDAIAKVHPLQLVSIFRTKADAVVNESKVSLHPEFSGLVCEARIAYDNFIGNLNQDETEQIQDLLTLLSEILKAVKRLADEYVSILKQMPTAKQKSEADSLIERSKALEREINEVQMAKYSDLLHKKRIRFDEILSSIDENAEKILK